MIKIIILLYYYFVFLILILLIQNKKESKTQYGGRKTSNTTQVCKILTSWKIPSIFACVLYLTELMLSLHFGFKYRLHLG